MVEHLRGSNQTPPPPAQEQERIGTRGRLERSKRPDRTCIAIRAERPTARMADLCKGSPVASPGFFFAEPGTIRISDGWTSATDQVACPFADGPGGPTNATVGPFALVFTVRSDWRINPLGAQHAQNCEMKQ